MKRYFLLSFLFPALLLACATGAQSAKPPLWVTDTEAAYPDREWLCLVETGKTGRVAETAALSALSRVFRVDVQSITNANTSFVEQMQKTGAKSLTRTASFRSFAEELTLVSPVSGLIGVERDSWTDGSGEVYALVRMNRAACAARYGSLIAENETLIALLIENAEARRGSFDAYANLAFAAKAAELTDSFSVIRSVLQPGAEHNPAYGSAGRIKMRMQEEARSIVIQVSVQGDVDSRVEKAFASVFSTRGFGAAHGETPYTLKADFKVEDAPQRDANFVYARFTLTASLMNKDGTELLPWSENDRLGHASPREARQRVIRKAEEVITETGFAPAFDAWFASLL